MTFKPVWEKDLFNDRLIVYLPEQKDSEMTRLKKEITDGTSGKIIVYTPYDSGPSIKKLGFIHEADMSGFFAGKKAAVHSLFLKDSRQFSSTEAENKQVLKVVNSNNSVPGMNWGNVMFRQPSANDIQQMTNLYKRVFNVYPTDIFESSYIKKAMQTDYLFIVAKDGEKVVGAASAMRTGFGSAEITDCAVDPAYRGKSILHGLILKLEEALISENIYHAFSITRAISTGMNMTVRRLSYSYEGTLVNNCKIATGFEDMNVWTKTLH